MEDPAREACPSGSVGTAYRCSGCAEQASLEILHAGGSPSDVGIIFVVGSVKNNA